MTLLIDDIKSEINVYYRISQLKYITDNYYSPAKSIIHLLNCYICYTQEYGVEINDKITDSYVITSDSFEKWYSWWDNYFRNEINYAEWYSRREEGLDLSMFRPKGNWKKEKELKKTFVRKF